MATAAELLVSASTASDGSTAGVHLVSIESASKVLGARLSSNILASTSNLETSLSSNALSSSTTMDLNLSSNISNLTSETC